MGNCCLKPRSEKYDERELQGEKTNTNNNEKNKPTKVTANIVPPIESLQQIQTLQNTIQQSPKPSKFESEFEHVEIDPSKKQLTNKSVANSPVIKESSNEQYNFNSHSAQPLFENNQKFEYVH